MRGGVLVVVLAPPPLMCSVQYGLPPKRALLHPLKAHPFVIVADTGDIASDTFISAGLSHELKVHTTGAEREIGDESWTHIPHGHPVEPRAFCFC